MKTFKEFIFEENANKIVQFKRKLAGATDPAEKARLQKAIADARAAAGGLAADPISKNALPKNESVDDELTRWLKIAHG